MGNRNIGSGVVGAGDVPSKKMKQQADRALSLGDEFNHLINRLGAFRHRVGTNHFADCGQSEPRQDEKQQEVPEEYMLRMEYALNELAYEAERLRARIDELESVG